MARTSGRAWGELPLVIGLMAQRSSRIGIVGGGQLGALLARAAHALGLWVAILDEDPQAPALALADRSLVGSWKDPATLLELARGVEVLTVERDDIGLDALRAVEATGVPVYPSPATLGLIQDKLVQREWLATRGFRGPRFAPCPTPSAQACEEFGLPLVQKLRRGGYDGRGVKLVRTPQDCADLLPGPSLLEEVVEIERELAVLVARGRTGDVQAYPVAEVEVDPIGHHLALMIAPARLEAGVAERARALAIEVVAGLGAVGVCAVELFLTRSGELLVNEVSPRVHNSGHHTLDASPTSQFEQHLRAVCGLPLGEASLNAPTVLVNLVGSGTTRGTPRVRGREQVEATPNAWLHLYGKAEVWPGRKMGHLTVSAPEHDLALTRARALSGALDVRAEESTP